MKKLKIFRRTLALMLATVTLAAVASCHHKIGDSTVSESDTSADLKSAEEKYYFPITERCFYDEEINLHGVTHTNIRRKATCWRQGITESFTESSLMIRYLKWTLKPTVTMKRDG